MGKLILALITTLLGFLSSGAMAQTYTTIVNGTSYDFSYITGSFNSNSALLQSQPWWGNQSTAQTFATAVGSNLGYPNTTFGQWGPYFAFNQFSVLPPPQVRSSYNTPNGSACCATPSINQSVSYAVATVSSAGAPEIDGALAPKVGFLLACLFLMFSRKRENTESLMTA